MVNDAAAEQLRNFIQSRLIECHREHSDPDAALRAGLASSVLVGVVTSRQISPADTRTQGPSGPAAARRTGFVCPRRICCFSLHGQAHQAVAPGLH
ncbi:hypothetical protein ACHMXB_05440 [Arthrobacter sp. UC242_113]|uniref:TetR/AcrR family transcriptional regulator n=1 Tax=Arthrobacter sp. UC242_113 TaxID=3374550 RepID=UPI0037579D76